MRARRILLIGALGCLGVLVARWSLREERPSPSALHAPAGEARHRGAAGHPDALPAVRRLRPGDAPPDAALVDQAGTAFRLSELRGHPVVLAFLYTHCDVASMYPTTARTFARLKARATADGLGDAEFLLVSFDPERDTPDFSGTPRARTRRPPGCRPTSTAPGPESRCPRPYCRGVRSGRPGEGQLERPPASAAGPDGRPALRVRQC